MQLDIKVFPEHLFLQFEIRPSKKFLTAQPNSYGVRILIENNPRMILQIHHVFDDDLSQLLSIWYCIILW